MATCEQDTQFVALDLPEEFEGLEGLIQTDLQALVGMLVTRAHERLYLTKREHRQLQAELWNGLTEAINTAAAPLSIANR